MEKISYKKSAIFSHFLIEDIDPETVSLIPVWKNSKDFGFKWTIDRNLIGRFYNAFLANKVLKNPIIKNNIVVGKLIIYTGCSSKELKEIGF